MVYIRREKSYREAPTTYTSLKITQLVVFVHVLNANCFAMLYSTRVVQRFIMSDLSLRPGFIQTP